MSDRDQTLASVIGAGMVPAGYAEKAMASLLQLHSELMEEKERRVDLYRRMSEKDQTIAELRMYVRLLEERMAATSGDAPTPVAEPPPAAVTAPASTRAVVPKTPPRPPKSEPRPVFAADGDGWKQW